MSADLPATKGHANTVTIVWIAIGAIFLYAFSPGPFVMMYYRCGEPPWMLSALEMIYAPLVFLTDQIPPLERFYSWYVELWRKL